MEARPTEKGADRDRDLEIAPTNGIKWFAAYGDRTVEMPFDNRTFLER